MTPRADERRPAAQRVARAEEGAATIGGGLIAAPAMTSAAPQPSRRS